MSQISSEDIVIANTTPGSPVYYRPIDNGIVLNETGFFQVFYKVRVGPGEVSDFRITNSGTGSTYFNTISTGVGVNNQTGFPYQVATISAVIENDTPGAELVLEALDDFTASAIPGTSQTLTPAIEITVEYLGDNSNPLQIIQNQNL